MNQFNPQAYWEQRLHHSFTLNGVGCANLGAGYNFWLYRVRRKVFLRKIRALCIDFANSEIVDIGSGTGFYIERWKELGGKNITGCDLTQLSVDNLQKKFPEQKFFQIDIGGDVIPPLNTNEYHAASAFDVLFHIVDDRHYQTAIQNIYSLLRPGGWFVFSDNFLHGESQYTEHQASRNLQEITALVQNVGFDIIERAPMFVLMNDPIDYPHTFYSHILQYMFKLIHKINILGIIIGAILYPIELLLTRYLREGPSTEIMICRKPNLTQD